MELFSGSSGFSYKEWKGLFYPEKIKNPEMLSYYGEHLNTVEINNTFYRMPRKEMLEGWATQVPDRFCFAVKAPQRITHRERLKGSQASTQELLNALDGLGSRLGVLLFQLPPFLKADVETLEAFLSLLPKGVRCAFEFRHPSWFVPEVAEVLRSHNVAQAWVDWDDADKPVSGVSTANHGYVRLRAVEYSDAQLKDWLSRFRDQGWERVHAFFKHENEATAPQLAQRLQNLSKLIL